MDEDTKSDVSRCSAEIMFSLNANLVDPTQPDPRECEVVNPISRIHRFASLGKSLKAENSKALKEMSDPFKVAFEILLRRSASLVLAQVMLSPIKTSKLQTKH